MSASQVAGNTGMSNKLNLATIQALKVTAKFGLWGPRIRQLPH